MASRYRFSLVNHDNGFSILDMMNGQETWFGPGIGTVQDSEGRAVPATRADFIDILEALLNGDESRTLEEYFQQRRREATQPQLVNSLMPIHSGIRLQSSSCTPILEFRRKDDGSIQRRELSPEEEPWIGPESRWQTLSRSEVIHYLNYGGIVGIWLDDLQDKGLIQTRQEKRAVAASGH